MGVKGLWDRFLGIKEVGSRLTTGKLLWLLGLAVLGIVLIFLGSTGEKDDNKPGSGATPGEMVTNMFPSGGTATEREEKALAEGLREMLSKIEGAGKVKVNVRLASSTREEHAVNMNSVRKEIEEKDQGGGERTTVENTDSGQMVITHNGQDEIPVVVQERAAEIAGVLVIAEGASNSGVKDKLFWATQVALGVEPQKILVLPMERGAEN